MDATALSRNREHYGTSKTVSGYDKMRPDYPDEVRQAVLNTLVKNASLGVGQRFMLDVGCGGGKSTKLFVDDFERLLGIDISQAQIDLAKQQVKRDNVSFQVVNDNLLPVQDGSTDLVFCGIAFHYLDKSVFFAECNRVLVPSGVVACALYGIDIVKSLDDQIICDYSVKPSRWEHVQREFGINCGVDKEIVDSYFGRYKDVFNAIKNPTKRYLKVAAIDRKFTVAEFMEFESTVAGYGKKSYPDPKSDPLNIYRGKLADIFRDAGMECEDDTEFVITINFMVMIIEKTKEFCIA